MMRGRIYKHHADQHDMASYSSSLREMDLDCRFRSDLVFLDVEKAAIVR